MQNLNNWTVTYLKNPHESLGRKGSVCPFVPGALAFKSLGISYFLHDNDTQVEQAKERLLSIQKDFLDYLETHPKRQKYQSKLISFVNIDQDENKSANLVEQVQTTLKPDFLKHSTMIGEFFPNCSIPGIHSPKSLNFQPFDYAESAVAMRILMPQDIVFVSDALEHVEPYLVSLGLDKDAPTYILKPQIVKILKASNFYNDTSKHHLEKVIDMLSGNATQKYVHFFENVKETQKLSLGLPGNFDLDLSELAGGLNVHSNNSGTPFSTSAHKLDGKFFERHVLSYFAEKFQASKHPDGSLNYFGYLTTGSTEGIDYGLYLGKSTIMKSESESESKNQPVGFFSSAAHQSVRNSFQKISVPAFEIPINERGEMNVAEFRSRVENLPENTHPLVCGTVGSVMQGAIDDIGQISDIVASKGGYLHLDAALFGGFLPDVQESDPLPINFSSMPIHSLSISLHKFLGHPIPCGIVLANNIDPYHPPALFNDAFVSYINAPNATLSCSRSGLAAIIASRRLESIGNSMGELGKQCIQYAKEISTRLAESFNIPSLCNEYSNIVYFECPTSLLEPYSLPVAGIEESQTPGEFSFTRIVVMPQHLDRVRIEEFFTDLEKKIH